MPKRRIPKLCKHKSTGQAFAVIDGRWVYFGKHGTTGADEKYKRNIAAWLNGEDAIPTPSTDSSITVAEVIAKFWRFGERHYAEHPRELWLYRDALKPVAALYGSTPANEFGPKALRLVRDEMIRRGWVRSNINRQVGRVKRVFKWAVSEELIRPTVFQALQAVEGLQAGRTEAAESDDVLPVPRFAIDAIRVHLSRPVQALVDLQLLTGARPGEMLRLRPIDIDTTGEVWTARLKRHKTAHKGKLRTPHFGPRAVEILRRFMDRPVHAYLFDPRESTREHKARDAAGARRPGQRPNPTKTDRKIRDRFDVASYRRAIHRACDKAGIERWSPNRLRHNAGTRFRAEQDIETARTVLGHTTTSTTEIYALADETKARELMRKIG